jgi:hypothetical protein
LPEGEKGNDQKGFVVMGLDKPRYFFHKEEFGFSQAPG